MTRGVKVEIKREWRSHYRAKEAPAVGVLQALSPSGSVARIRMDGVADSYVLTCHLEEAPGRSA